MIPREELELIISGCVSQAGSAIAGVNGHRLTRAELEAMGGAIAVAIRMVADRCAVRQVPPPAPIARERKHAMHFNPLATQEIRPVPKGTGEQ